MKHGICQVSLAVAIGGTLVLAAGCGDSIKCGSGAYLADNICQGVDENQRVKCGPGFEVRNGLCWPSKDWLNKYCGKDSAYDPVSGQCIGTGGGTDACSDAKFRCPAASGSTVCLSGRVFPIDQVIEKDDKGSPTPLIKEQLAIKVYDPFAFIAGPDPGPILASATAVDDNGCFIIPSAVIPFGQAFMVVVDDSGSDDRHVMSAHLMLAAVGQNLTSLATPSVSRAMLDTWSTELGGTSLEKAGTLIIRWKNAAGPLAGFVPLQDKKEPANWGSGKGEVFYFDDNPTTPPVFKTGATETGKTATVLIRAAAITTYGGKKGSCNLTESLLGSKPGTVAFTSGFTTDPSCN